MTSDAPDPYLADVARRAAGAAPDGGPDLDRVRSRVGARRRARAAASAVAALAVTASLAGVLPLVGGGGGTADVVEVADAVRDELRPAVAPDGWLPCPAGRGEVAALCPDPDRGDLERPDRIVVVTGAHDALPEDGAPVAVGPRVGYVRTTGDERVLTVSDRTADDDTHYRVTAPVEVTTDELVDLVRSIPRFADVVD